MGIVASSLYTVWIARFSETLELDSKQLLLNQAPASCVMLVYAIPWIDSVPQSDQVSVGLIAMIVFVSVIP